jgi:DNA topoisomerase VI subunit B
LPAPRTPPVGLRRVAFRWPRSAEYFQADELQAQTGQPRRRFADVFLKETLDNGYDAAETARRAPVIQIRVRYFSRRGRVRICVIDNGAGIPPDLVESILNYDTRTSDKAAYNSPTRGRQGNATKASIGIPFALGCTSPVVIEACGKRHVIRVRDNFAGGVEVDDDVRDVPDRGGTRVLVTLPTADLNFRPLDWAERFALFNPHATVKILQTGGPSPKKEVC